jgi:hypothetical protein
MANIPPTADILDFQRDLPGIARRAIAEQFESGVFTVTLTGEDAAALGVLPDIEFTATTSKCWVKARYADNRDYLEAHDEPGEPERQEQSYRHGLAHPASSALGLLALALLNDDREG